MKITEVRIFSTESRDGKLKAFATMTFDDWFVVRNVKIIQGNNGLFVAMPSRKAVDSCPKCRGKNARGSKYCNQCGAQINSKPEMVDESGRRQGSHMDIAHPITQECRVYLQEEILKAYEKENTKKEAEGSDYKSATEDDLNFPAEEPPKEEQPAGEEKPADTLKSDETKDIEL